MLLLSEQRSRTSAGHQALFWAVTCIDSAIAPAWGEALFLFRFTKEETAVERLTRRFLATRMCQFSRHSYSKTSPVFHRVCCQKLMNIQDEMENSKRYYAPCSWGELSCPSPQFRKAPRRLLEQKTLPKIGRKLGSGKNRRE